MLNLNKFCSLFIGLILSVVCALPLSARDINVRGTVTNIEGEPLFRVSIYNAGTDRKSTRLNSSHPSSSRMPSSA